MIRGFEIVDEKYLQEECEAFIPRRTTKGSSGYDFKAPKDIKLLPGQSEIIMTNLRAYMLPDEELLLFPRSSTGLKGLKLSNTVGKIDSDFYKNRSNGGNIGFLLENSSSNTLEFERGDKIMQGTFYKYLVVDNDVPVSEERTGGLGSTNN